ncbi:NUDIX domain-containing protein [Breznakibacter xylanolyticus]|nr:NUDIX domain-containing protein [Breznakibacter xylanolyticus]
MNKLQLIKQLIPGLLPLLIYMVAEDIWGTTTGLIVAIVFGVGELAWGMIRKQKPDRFLLIDMGLIVVMGSVSVWLDNDVFFRLKPVVIGAVMVVMLAVVAWGRQQLMESMTHRYMNHMTVNPWQMWEMQLSFRRMVVALGVYTLLTLAVALWGSLRWWGIVSGPGMFVVMGVYFCIEFIFKRHQQKKYATQEWLPLTNAQGEVLGKAPRSVVHGGSRLLHPVVHLHVVNHKGVYLQKRPLHKQIQPGKWDTAVGGHVDVGESIDKALARETVEEIGLTSFRARLLGQYVWESSVERELVYSFITADDHGISFNPGELDDARFWSMEEIRANLRRGVFTPNFEREFDEYLGGCFL